MKYKVFVLESAFDTLAAVRGRKRREIREFIRSLAENPFLEVDFTENDSSGRSTYTKVIRDHAVVFFPDHAVKEVKVIEINKADE